ncbi:MAG: hypothetical protein ACI8VW_002731 [bacterium]
MLTGGVEHHHPSFSRAVQHGRYVPLTSRTRAISSARDRAISDYTQLPVPDMDQWSTEQVLAVYDLCQMIRVTLMHQFEDQLLEKMIECDERRHAFIQLE